MEKETLDYSFWIGLALAIPLSIVGNILTPKIQNIFARYSKKKSEKRIAQLEASLDEHKELSASAEKIQIFLLEGILLITMLTSVMAVFSGTIFALSYIFPGDNKLIFFGQVFSVLGAVMVTKECFSTLVKAKRAKRIDKFENEIKAELKQLRNISD